MLRLYFGKYNHKHACNRCRQALEYIYTLNNVDTYYCSDCKLEQVRTLESVNDDTRLSELYGE